MCQAACNEWSATPFPYFGILLGQYCVCDFDLENIVKHGKLINKGFELYETINIHSVYIQNNAVHYDWVGSSVAPLSTPFLGEDIDFKTNGIILLYSLMELVGIYIRKWAIKSQRCTKRNCSTCSS